MRLQEPPGLGNQWRTLRLFPPGGATVDFGNVPQPTALVPLYGGIFNTLTVPIGQDNVSVSLAFIAKNEDPLPTATFSSLKVRRLSDGNGTLLAPGTEPQSTLFVVHATNQVTATTTDVLDKIVWDPAFTTHSNGGVLSGVVAFGTGDASFFLSQPGWHAFEANLSWNEA